MDQVKKIFTILRPKSLLILDYVKQFVIRFYMSGSRGGRGQWIRTPPPPIPSGKSHVATCFLRNTGTEPASRSPNCFSSEVLDPHIPSYHISHATFRHKSVINYLDFSLRDWWVKNGFQVCLC